MKRMLINATHPDEVRVAITRNSILIDLDIERPGLEQKKANIYKGIITSIEPSLGAVFVNYGSERHGFLPLKEISKEYYLIQDPDQLENPDIRRILKEGQELVIQIDKEERGTKGAALTTFISLAGSYLVLMPNNPRAGGISRRIEDEEHREQLRDALSTLNVPEGMGLIIRTAGVGRTKEELEWDLNVLLRYWEAIKQAAIAKPGPYLIHQEDDVIIRAVRDYLRQDVEEILVDDANSHERIRQYISQVRPDFLDRLKLYSGHLPLFSRHQLEKQIEEVYQREVRLPSGGSIVIDHTEALVSIDINSSRATKGSNIEETAFETNLEAADEIARQLRIRDIGGLIVIDFIDMTAQRNQREVENRLRNAVHLDRARIQMGRISRFGLMEMSRQRLRSSLAVANHIPCPRCEGRGTIRSVESLSLSILHLIQEHSARAKGTVIQAQVPVDIATYLLNEKRDVLNDIEKLSQNSVSIIPNPHLTAPQYQVRVGKEDVGKTTPSYKVPRAPKPEITKPAAYSKETAEEPAVTEFLTDVPAPAPRRPGASKVGIMKKFLNIVFGDEDETEEKKPVREKEAAETPYQKQPDDRRGQQRRRGPGGGGGPGHHHKRPRTRRGSRGGQRRGGSNRPHEGGSGYEQRSQFRGQREGSPGFHEPREYQTQPKEEPIQTSYEQPESVEKPQVETPWSEPTPVETHHVETHRESTPVETQKTSEPVYQHQPDYKGFGYSGLESKEKLVEVKTRKTDKDPEDTSQN